MYKRSSEVVLKQQNTVVILLRSDHQSIDNLALYTVDELQSHNQGVPTRWLNMTKWLKSVDLSDTAVAVLSLAYDKIVPE